MLLKRIQASEFLRHNAIFFGGAVAVGALNYVYYPVLGRLLPTAAFGEVQTLVSLFLQLAVFLNVLSMITVNIVVNARDTKRANQLIVDFEKAALLLGIIVLVLSLFAAPALKTFLQFDSTLPFAALGVALVAAVPYTFRSAYLRGRRKFGQVSIANVVPALGKLILSTVFVIAGLSTFGAMLGLVGAQLFGLGYALVMAARAGLPAVGWREYFLRPPSLRRLRPELKYGVLVLVVSLAITLQYSIDIVVVKHYFDPHTAGLYAGIAAVARIIFFATASITQVMLPGVRLANSPKQNRTLLFKSVVLLCTIALPVLFLSVFYPHFVVKLLMGVNYLSVSPLLPKLTIAIFIVSVLNAVMAYFTALRKHNVMFVGIIGSAVTFVVMLSHHSTLAAVVDSMLLGSLAMGGLLGLWVGGTKLKRGIHAAATHIGHRTGL